MSHVFTPSSATQPTSIVPAQTLGEALQLSQLPVHTVSPETPVGYFQVSADRRSNKENPLSDADRIRRIVLPDAIWDGLEVTERNQRSDGLRELLTAKLREVAQLRLRDLLSEEPMLRTVDAAQFTVGALLAWNTERAATTGGIGFERDDVLAWFETSKLRSDMIAKHGNKAPAVLAFLRQRYGALAARNHGLTKPEDAAKLLVMLPDSDLTGPASDLLGMVANRLVAIEKSLTAKLANEAAVSLDDL